jgi:hypothetical protein
MLDFTQLVTQLEEFSQDVMQEAKARQKRVERAGTLLQDAGANQEHWVTLRQDWRDRLGFSAAEPLEPLQTVQSVLNGSESLPTTYTVLATDGSQIAPSHHEIAFCYLLNIGRVVIHYGNKRYPLLDSLPEVFYKSSDLYQAQQWGISTEEWMGYRRTVLEMEVLADLVESLRDDRPQDLDQPSTALALVDGSLIYWFLDGLPAAAREQLLPPLLSAWQRIQAAGVPLVGYISASRSVETLNFLRLLSCPHPVPDCDRYCSGKTDTYALNRPPCQVFSPLKDTTFWQNYLKPGQRGPLWRSHARVLSHYGDQQLYFCHLHVGSEVARIEFPAEVAENPQVLQQALTLVLTQVQKGYGYPIALAEAHNQAVVRSTDRRRFFALLEQSFQQAGLNSIAPSAKETRKRESIA